MAFLVLVAFLVVPVALRDQRLGPPWRRLYITHRSTPNTKDE